jgi:hypothetical protein
MDIRLKEHPDKSAIAEDSIDQGHRIQFHNSSILTTKSRYMDRIVTEAIKIEYQQRSSLSQQIMEASYRLLETFGT